jgi:hypothetical protein
VEQWPSRCMFPAGPGAPGEQQRSIHTDCGDRKPPRRSHKSNMVFDCCDAQLASEMGVRTRLPQRKTSWEKARLAVKPLDDMIDDGSSSRG